MRTHRVKLTCTSEECAKFVVEDLNVTFCDFTHWFCGLDHAGEDTPDSCIIYCGYVHPEVVYIEFDSREIYGENDVSDDFILNKFNCMYAIRTGEKADQKVKKIEVEKLPCFAALEDYKKKVQESLMTRD